jgi:hypothetical protein
MKPTHANYRLVPLGSSSTGGFTDALRLYSNAFPPSLKTNTNEITYWLDNYSKFGGDRFLVFAFYANKHLVGYAQLAYFDATCLVVVDYLVVDKAHRRDNVFFEFIEHLRVAIDASSIQVDYVVAEVALDEMSDDTSAKPMSLLRLLRYIGFGVARALYYQPQLGAKNYESKTRAALAISVTGDVPLKALRRETYLSIVETIYYRHYLRWYSIYPEEEREYRKHIDKVFREVRDAVALQEFIVINGHPLPANTKSVVQSQHDTGIFKFAAVGLAVVAVLTVLLFAITKYFNVTVAVVMPVYILALISVFAVLSLISKEAKSVLRELVKLLLSWSKTK